MAAVSFGKRGGVDRQEREMGLRDRLTDLRKQAQETVAEHKDEIQGAMETAGSAVDKKTHGKYTDKIAKYGQKASNAVENFSGQGSGEPTSEHPDAAGNPEAPKPGGGTAAG
ncbi:MAG: antitoxin [Solirubrobacteraceae bacterium]